MSTEKSLFRMIRELISENGGAKALFHDIPPALGNATEAAASKVGGAILGTASTIGEIINWWRRKSDEPLNSLPVALKGLSIAIAYALYRKYDPLPNRKIDNVFVTGIAAYLIGMLLFPKDNPASIERFEEMVALGAENLALESRVEVLAWAQSLTTEQKRQIAQLFAEAELTAQDIAGSLSNSGVRDLLVRLMPEETRNLAGLMEKAGQLFSNSTNSLVSNLKAADEKAAGQIYKFRQAINRRAK